ncbi:MAG: hypothetical protein L0K86_11565, partial [Actinomycetia bacterium]|nr:hypothetical protein [Actinomycetes bacterium]
VTSGITARTVAQEWGRAAVLARSLTPAIAGRRPLVVGPSTVGALVKLAGVPQVTSRLVYVDPPRTTAQMLQITVGPLTWEVCGANADIFAAARVAPGPRDCSATTPPRTTTSRKGADNSGRSRPRPPRTRHHPDITTTGSGTTMRTTMGTAWSLAVLPTGAENLLPLLDGQEVDVATAFAAATAALVDIAAALGTVGWQEHRITVAGRPSSCPGSPRPA